MMKRELIILSLCLVIGFALRVYAFDHKSLWIDEVHTFNDSRDDFRGQIKFYKENPTYLHPPLFFVLTHLFYPFTKPERDLRVIPLLFGTLSIPMIYFLSRSFSPGIALPCTLSLTFMVYHIYFSQEGRSYSLLMFLGMVALYFFVQHLKTSKKVYLFLVGFLFAVLLHTSYSALLFIVFSQILWFYNFDKDHRKPSVSSFLILNGLFLLFCLPGLLFIALNYKGQPAMDPHHIESTGSFGSILYWIFNDWVSNLPLIIAVIALLVVFPFFSKSKKNALIFLALLILPIGSLFLLCQWLNITHFFSSRYFINFLPLFFISIFLSLDAIESKFHGLKHLLRFKLFLTILLIASNLIILPLYYRSEKQDFRGLVAALKDQILDGDNVFVRSNAYLPGILHYFGIYPKERHYGIAFSKDAQKGIEYRVYSLEQKKAFSIYYSENCCSQYGTDGNRLWIIVEKATAQRFRKDSPCALRGYFDGSFAIFRKFPTDASMYLFLWDPKSPGEKGIDLPLE